MASVLEPPPEIGFVVYKDRIVYKEDHHIEEGWTDRGSVERNSPRLKRALRATGVLWKDLQVKTQADFAMEGTQPVPPNIQRQRLYAHEKLRQEQLHLVLEARRGMLRDGMRLTGASSAPPSLMDGGGGDGEKVLTPMEMAKQKAEQALVLREMKRQATKEAGEKRLADLAKQMEVAAVLAEEAAKKQDEVTAQFEAKKREQARLIIEKRQAAMEFRLKRERQKEVELQAEFVFARKAEEARIRKDELIEQKRIATQAAMREKGAAFKQKHKAKLARIAAEALELQENSDVMALEKEKIIEEKHKALKKRVRESQKITVELNAARAAEQLLRRRQLFAKREEQLEEQKAETLAHLEDVDRRLKEKQRRTEERIERQKKEAVEREMGRSVTMEEKEQSLLDESMELEAKRSAKEIYMESVAEERERERRHAVEARKLNYVARMKKVKRLQRQQEFQSVLQKEDFEAKELKTNALLETKKKLVEEQRVGAVHFSVQSETTRKKHAKGTKALYGPTAQVPDYGIFNHAAPIGLVSQRMGMGGAI